MKKSKTVKPGHAGKKKVTKKQKTTALQQAQFIVSLFPSNSQ